MALYQKARPQTFDEVEGQEAVIRTLRNQIQRGEPQHAYLFCGTRGTGKTTIARILAKAVNCEHTVNGNPCNECDTCKDIAAGRSMNVIEIDAASNNSVDNIREIVDEVRYRPTQGKYKVYIIDEVHMLSTGAFNALLKTLEEPPEYVIFILATTEAGKIPATILSRCQRYDFHRLPLETIIKRMQELMDKEGITCEENALRFVARQADGSMRDALSLLERCTAFSAEKTLTYNNVLDTLGAVDTDVYENILSYIAKRDAGNCVLLFQQMLDKGREANQFVTDFLMYLRNLLLVDAAPSAVDASAEQIETMKTFSKNIPEKDIIRFITVLSDLQSTIRFSTNRRILTEVALIRLCHPQMEQVCESSEKQEDVGIVDTEPTMQHVTVQLPAGVLDANCQNGKSVDGIWQITPTLSAYVLRSPSVRRRYEKILSDHLQREVKLEA